MKNKIILLITILLVILLAPNCSKDDLVLDQDYVTVSDLMKYCSKASCYKPVEWNGKEVKVKGHIHNYMLDNKKEKYWLIDIRNSNYIEIYVDSSCIDTIFNKITSSNNIMNMCYITGTLKSFEMETMFKCTVGCEILLHSADDIYFENKY